VVTQANWYAYLQNSPSFYGFLDDPYVAMGGSFYVSPSEVEFTVSVAANAPAETDYFLLSCWDNNIFYASAFITPAAQIPPDNGSNLGACTDCNGQTGAPVNLTNGNVWVQQRDYSLPGLGGGPALVRTWNSLLGTVGPLNVAGMFGQSWRSTYEEMLAGPDSNDNLKYWRGDGSAWTFAYNGTLGSYTLLSPPNVRAQLWSNPAGGFTLTLVDGTQRVFNANNQLSALIDRNGNQTTMAYDSSNRLISATSAGGSTLTFTYGNSNNTTLVTSVQDSVGTVATYTYDTSSRLTQVSYPDGSALNFTYDPTYSNLLSITDSQGGLIEAHTYDTQYRGLTSTRANGVDSVSLSY
jgi:YD repeat-containing protein